MGAGVGWFTFRTYSYRTDAGAWSKFHDTKLYSKPFDARTNREKKLRLYVPLGIGKDLQAILEF